MSTTNGTGRPVYDAGAPVDGFPSMRELMSPRVRRNYTQGAKGEWRAEFTVESHHDPLTEEGSTAITAEDACVALSIHLVQLALNGPDHELAERMKVLAGINVSAQQKEATHGNG